LDWLRITRRTKWLVAFYSVLFPGLGHILSRNYNKALLLSTGYAMHLIMMYRIVINLEYIEPLSLAFIVLVIPSYYFYSVYDSLQQYSNDSRKPQQLSQVSFVILACLIVLSMIILAPNQYLQNWSFFIINYYPSLLLIIVSGYLWNRLYHKEMDSYYIGRITTASIFLIIAILLWLEAKLPIHWFNFLYILPVIIVFEAGILIVRRLWLNRIEKYHFDFKSLMLSALTMFVVFVVLEYSTYPTKWLQSFYGETKRIKIYDEEAGYSFQQPPIKIAMQDEITSINVEHLNGYVRLIYKDIEEIEITSTLFVQGADVELAEDINRKSHVEVDLSDQVSIRSVLEIYESGRVPRLNMTISVPRDTGRLGKLTVHLNHGSLHINDIQTEDGAYIETDTANINFNSFEGDVEVQSSRGNLYMLDTLGSINAQIQKGNILLINPYRNVAATTLNGLVYLQGEEILGDWKAETTIGNILIKLPKNEDYQLFAKVTFGKIHFKEDIVSDVKQYEYSVGKGKYDIHLTASNYIGIE